MIALLLALPAYSGEFMDVWVTTALEDDNVLAGPADYSPAPNFVTRGNQTFFEQYESKYTDDISQSYLALYREDQGFIPNVFTEAAFVLRFQPYTDPDQSKAAVSIADGGSYVRVGYKIGGADTQVLSLTGYAVDADRFRLGYSYDLTWGGRDIFVMDPRTAPGVRLQYQNGSFYAFAGLKTAVGDYRDLLTDDVQNQAFFGGLLGAGSGIGDYFRLEGGVGDFQQGQLGNVADVSSPLYNAPIYALGGCGQVAFRTNADLDYIVSNELKLYRNRPDQVVDTYIRHRQLEGAAGLLVQVEGNYLVHNLLDFDQVDATVIEPAFAGDVQSVFVAGSTEVGLDLVYKDLSYIMFNVPGLTSGYAISDTLDVSPQVYVRGSLSHYFPKARLTPSVGAGYMIPASYGTADSGYTVVYRASADSSTAAATGSTSGSKPSQVAVPTGQQPTALLSAVGGLQWDISRSVVAVGEVLYTLDNNQSVSAEGDSGTVDILAASNVRNALGFNLMLRARF
jgi:hypothetical protein